MSGPTSSTDSFLYIYTPDIIFVCRCWPRMSDNSPHMSLCSLALVKSTHARLGSDVVLCADVLREIIAYARVRREHYGRMVRTLARIRFGLFWHECGHCSFTVLRWHGSFRRVRSQETFLCNGCYRNRWIQVVSQPRAVPLAQMILGDELW